MEKMVNYIYSKLIFLSYLKYLRIIILTINIILYNWGGDKIGVIIKNSVFIIDLVRILKSRKVKLKNIIKFMFYSEV